MTQQLQTLPESGDVITVPLNKLKASPRNARKTPHAAADIAALAASIAVKGVLQAPVVEPETDGEGAPTGCFFVTIGEGRRQALQLLAKQKAIGKATPVRCVVDLNNDPHEISLDENVTRAAMHPADQFEAFRRLSEDRGLGAEEIGARFGVSAQVVRQRLRLGAVSPKLMGLYRQGELTLDQLMAFCVSEDHARQEQVFEMLTWNKAPHTIRRAMTEEKVAASDRRAIFVGAEAYAEGGGAILRDLFTEDGGGWFEDVALLDRLACEKLAALAEATRAEEGWKWAEGRLDYPRAEGLARVYPHPVERSAEVKAAMHALSEEYDALVSQWDSVEDLPEEVAARFDEIDADLEAFGDGTAYDADEIARGGLFVVLGVDGIARIERGFIRPEDQVVPESAPDSEGDDGGQGAEPRNDEPAEDEEADGLAPRASGARPDGASDGGLAGCPGRKPQHRPGGGDARPGAGGLLFSARAGQLPGDQADLGPAGRACRRHRRNAGGAVHRGASCRMGVADAAGGGRGLGLRGGSARHGPAGPPGPLRQPERQCGARDLGSQAPGLGASRRPGPGGRARHGDLLEGHRGKLSGTGHQGPDRRGSRRGGVGGGGGANRGLQEARHGVGGRGALGRDRVVAQLAAQTGTGFGGGGLRGRA